MTLNPPVLPPGTIKKLPITDSHRILSILTALTYAIPINATGDGFMGTENVRLFVGSAWVFLPIIMRIDLEN